MINSDILLPSIFKTVKDDGGEGVFEIGGLYPGYGHTLGNSLRRVILSSIPGVAISSVKIDGVEHEYSTIDGVYEDVIVILLNLKKIRFMMDGDEERIISLKKVKGPKKITAKDFELPGDVQIVNKSQVIAELTNPNSTLNLEVVVSRGLGFLPKESHRKTGAESIGSIPLDCLFSPIRKVNYEVENMRVGDRTDFDLLRMKIQTDGSISARDALEDSIKIMLMQLRAIVNIDEKEQERMFNEKHSINKVEGFIDNDGGTGVDSPIVVEGEGLKESSLGDSNDSQMVEVLKTRVEKLDLPEKIIQLLSEAGIRTTGGLVRKNKDDILNISGIGAKALSEIEGVLSGLGLSLS